MDKNWGIGLAGKMAWHLPVDLKLFSSLTRENEEEMEKIKQSTSNSMFLETQQTKSPVLSRKSPTTSLTSTFTEKKTNKNTHGGSKVDSTSEHMQQNIVIMGRKTWNSLDSKYQPLPGRENLVLSIKNSDQSNVKGARFFNSIEALLEYIEEKKSLVHVIGGANVYKQFLEKKLVSEAFISHLEGEWASDTSFPFDPKIFRKKKTLFQFEDIDKISQNKVNVRVVHYQLEYD